MNITIPLWSTLAWVGIGLAAGSLGLSPRCAGQDLTGETVEHGIPAYSVRNWLQADATLRAITFVDPDRGWAVGDRGVILASDSGGDRWAMQSTPTAAPLYDVHFVDARRGMAVGGYYSTDTQTSRGVALMTSDGGRHWRRLDADLPLLRSVRLQANGTIVAAGDFSTIHMASVFLSSDGGRTWLAAPADSIARTQDLSGPPDGPTSVLASDGILYHLPSVLQPAQAVLADARLRSIHGEAQDRVAVGTGGSLHISRDGGQHWQPHPPGIPATRFAAPESTVAGSTAAAADASSIDWHTAATAAGTVFAAGAPGKAIRRIAMDGSEHDVPTPIHAPLRALHFYDSQRGWAVGGFGTILATRDAGQTWRVQRGGDHRAAILVVGQHSDDVPWSVVANESLERGRRVAVGTLSTTAPASADALRPNRDSLTAQVACSLGGGETFAWRIDPATHRADTDSIRIALQSYRPRVLVLSSAIDSAHRRLWIQLATEAGVQRVLEPTAKAYSEWTLHSLALLPRTGVLLSDLQWDAAAVLQQSGNVAQDQYFRRTFDAMIQTGHSINDPLDGLLAATPAETRTIDTAPSRHALQILQARGGESRMVAKMLADGDRSGSFLQRFKLTLRQTPSENRARLARRVLQGCRQTDQPHLYRQTLQVLVEQLPDTPLGQWAVLRLHAVQNSHEWNQLDRATTRREVQTASSGNSVQLSPFAQDDSPPVRQAAAVGELVVTPDYTPEHGVGIPSDIADRNRPDLVWDFDPRVVLIRNSANAYLQPLAGPAEASEGPAEAGEGPAEASSELDPLNAGGGRGHWKQVVGNPSLQSWGQLFAPTSQTALAVGRTANRPYLDGRLNEPCWQAARPWATAGGYEVRFTYDSQHIYWSATGVGPIPAAAPSADASRRTRDANLDDAPRLALKIDTNRDLCTAFGLEVDRHGRTRDTCDGFTGWQPMWFVDTDESNGRWTVEAAIRRSDLSPLPPVIGSHWNVSVRIWNEGHDAWERRLPSSDDWIAVQFQ